MQVIKQLLYVLTLILFITFVGCQKPNKEDAEWIQLFNGQDLDNWIAKIHHYETGDNFDSTFRVKDDMIQVRYDNYGELNDRFGHLFYKTPFSKYHLKLEYRFVGTPQPGTPEWAHFNSGVMFHAQDPASILKEQDWPIAVEMQFLCSLGDGNPRPTGNMCSPGTDIHYRDSLYKDHCLYSTSKTYPPGEWVKAELIVYGDSLITHVINDDTVLQYTKPTMGGGVVSGYDPKVFVEGKPLTSGYIGLQSEGQPIDFRNIYLKELK
ncbi:3-keto-disaccharide hydrolase [Chryseosolibacter indicus]|uniref:DUF1080 domain-containing protein n=1 Tax=Chryseosolibacter indicus TaxID=2782351 RepID=A0ABS5VVL4_9BACT|nr:DUF1080 domain-containing protein [Chryseosolibacter indicus]MBT1704764.1 DUF1080 domain-containing protein [Chryseosolibacter indicus]